MIKRTIHYCWFGGKEKPSFSKKCISSWRKNCPGYDIVEWNESNFDVCRNRYARYCYDNKKWAFLSDFVRLEVIAEYGGIYFDTDVELVGELDGLLQYEAFYGFENNQNIATGLGFGAQANHPTVLAMRQQYLDLQPLADGSYPTVACPALNTKALLPFGLKLDGTRQNIAGAEIFPSDWFNPYDDPTGRLNKTENTVSIHWYSKSWISKKKVFRSILTRPLHRFFGANVFKGLRK